MKSTLRFLLASLLISALLPLPAQAVSFSAIRIGDIDGFGFGTGSGLTAANGGAVNVDGSGILGTGDFLPDLNTNGTVATGSGDDFDNRSPAEIAGNFLTGSGYTDVATTGSDFTDIALSTSFDNTFGTPNDFPSPPSTSLSNQPGFVFDFFVADADITADITLFLNLVFGDYDVSPASVVFERADGSTFSQSLTLQPGNQDGLIQAAFATLAFSDVFTAAAGGYDGYLEVDFNAPNEPYTAFDFAEIGTTQIDIEPNIIPEPGTLALFAMAGLGFLAWGWRRK